MFTRGRVLIASLIAMSLVGGLLIAPAVGLSPATEARAGEGIAFASSEHWIDQSYEDATGVHVYVTEPTIHFYSEDEAEPPEGFANYDLQLQLVEAATSTQVAEKVLEMVRDYSASEAEWAVPAGLLEFGSNYQLRYRLTAGGEQGDWSGWFTLAITAPSVAPSLVAPDDGAISLKGVMLVAQMYDTDSDDFSDAYEVAHIDDGFDPLVYNEKVSEYEWLAEAAIGFFCGEVDICSNSTIPWLVGNIASGILVFGDLRDGIAFIAKGDWLMASFCAVGLIPGIGDAAGATSKVTKFILKLVNPFGLRVASVAGVGSIASAGMHWRPAIQLLRQYSKTPTEFVKQLIKIDPGVVDSLRGTYRLSDKGITDLVSKNGLKRFQAYSLLDEASGQVRIITDYTAVTRPRFLVNGAAGEGLLAKVMQLPKGFKQSLTWIDVDGVMKARFWDGNLTIDNVITKVFEAKVGYVSSGFALAQVRKDVAWLAANPGKSVEWHFFASKTTGMIGPSENVLGLLKDAGVTIVFHFPGTSL